MPQHRGVDGGEECQRAFSEFTTELQRGYRQHDPLIQALASHYHIAAMHPFLDGNGRTARALEALLLQRAGLGDSSFIAMSNYYYDEKAAYLRALAETRAKEHDLTPFLIFALKGIALQCHRLLSEIQHEISKELFRTLMYDLFNRLKSPRRRVIAQRQIEVLKLLLAVESAQWPRVIEQLQPIYRDL
jgi:Fic family protein